MSLRSETRRRNMLLNVLFQMFSSSGAGGLVAARSILKGRRIFVDRLLQPPLVSPWKFAVTPSVAAAGATGNFAHIHPAREASARECHWGWRDVYAGMRASQAHFHQMPVSGVLESKPGLPFVNNFQTTLKMVL